MQLNTDFLTVVCVMLAAAFCCGWVTRALGMTQTAGELFAGLLVGPSLLGQLSPGLEHRFLPSSAMPAVGLFGLIIVLVYVAQTGAEIDARVFEVRGTRLVLIVAASTAIALLSAVVIERSFTSLVPLHASSFAFTLFVAAALLITAVPVLARILDETGLTRTYVGGSALAIAVYVDFVAFTIAAIATPLARSHISLAVLQGPAVLVGTLVLCLLLAPAVRRIKRQHQRIGVEVAILALALAAASATNASPLVAAFIVGAVLWRSRVQSEKGATASSALLRALVPIYIVYSGFKVNLGSLAHANLIVAAVLVLALAVLGKLVASWIGARMLGLESYQARVFAVLFNARGLTELILISLGHSAGILSESAYSILFLMTLVTTAASGMLARIAVSDTARVLRGPFETGLAAMRELDG